MSTLQPLGRLFGVTAGRSTVQVFMGLFVLRYNGDFPDSAASKLAKTAAVRVLEADGRNLLVEAGQESDVESALADRSQWIVSPESSTPPPATPHPIVRRPLRKPPPRGPSKVRKK